MNVLILTQWFDPEPTFKGLLFAKKLAEKGCDVEVLTGFPNYPGGNVYDGYRIKPYQMEEIEGIPVHRVAVYPSHDKSGLKRAINYLSFFFSSALCGIFKLRKFDVIYCYHPPLTTGLSALLISLFRRTPFVLDVQDLWPDTLASTGMVNNQKVLKVVGALCKIVYRRAKKIVVLSPGFKRKLMERGVPQNKLEVIYNWADEDVLRNPSVARIEFPSTGALNIVMAGNLGAAQGLPALIEAAALVAESDLGINLVFVGDGVAKPAAQSLVEQKHLDNVFFLPRVPMNEVGALLASADALLVHLNSSDLFKITVPSRTQAYMAVGKPIIMGVEGDAASLIEETGGGVVCSSNDPESIAEALITFANMSVVERSNMGRANKEFYDAELSVAKGVKRFFSVLSETCEARI